MNIPRDFFYGLCEDEIYPSLTVSRGGGPREALEAAARLLLKAKTPVILAGGGVSKGNALEEVMALAEYLTAPVANTYLHNDTFPGDHPLAVGPIGYCGSKAAMRTLAKADVVLALGTRLGPFGTLPQYGLDYWPERAKLIQVDMDARVLGLSRRVDVASPAEVKAFAREMILLLKTRKPENRGRSKTAAGAGKGEAGLGRGIKEGIFLQLQADAPPEISLGIGPGHPGGFHRHHGHRQ